MSMALLEILGLTKSFGDKTALRGINLKLDEGEILGLMGPNGSGKTTLLRIVALLIRPTEGRLTFDGTDCNGSEAERRSLRRKMAFVFQRPALFNMSVEGNIAVGLKIRKIQEGEIKDRVDEVVGQFGLSELRNRHVRTLSGGEAQRVALARALVVRPRLLLLDEPTASADPMNASMIERAVVDANAHLKTTVLIATHNPHQAKRLATETAFLFEGRVVERGNTSRLLESPKDERTAAYVSGRMA